MALKSKKVLLRVFLCALAGFTGLTLWQAYRVCVDADEARRDAINEWAKGSRVREKFAALYEAQCVQKFVVVKDKSLVEGPLPTIERPATFAECLQYIASKHEKYSDISTDDTHELLNAMESATNRVPSPVQFRCGGCRVNFVGRNRGEILE